MTVDLSLVVTVHNETSVCGPTMHSADIAVAAARAAGLTVETLISLDSPTEATRTYFEQARFDHWERHYFEERDLGFVRNAAVRVTEGRLVAFLDADDLFSENWLVDAAAAIDAATADGRRVIAHPELNILFDASRAVLVNLPQDSKLFTPHYLYARHSYDSLCMAPREAHLEVPYGHNDLRNGLAYEDFQFTIESLDAGWQHIVVPDTIIFKRRRDDSLVTASNDRKSIVRALPGMAIDRVRELGRRG